MGWGKDEMAGYKYWGGKNDYATYLREKGFEVYTASVGPVSSNWDRAVELFYQIKEKAIQRLRHRSRSKNLRRYLG